MEPLTPSICAFTRRSRRHTSRAPVYASPAGPEELPTYRPPIPVSLSEEYNASTFAHLMALGERVEVPLHHSGGPSLALAAGELAEHTSTAAACRLLGWSRATHYRPKAQRSFGPRRPRPAPGKKLSSAEAEPVMAVLNSQRFGDKSAAQTCATLLDEGTYLCSASTLVVQAMSCTASTTWASDTVRAATVRPACFQLR